MPKTTAQGALQAAAVLQKARETNREVRVSSSTNTVKLISAFETKLLNAFPKLRALFAEGRSHTDWEDKAKESILQKLKNETNLFKKNLNPSETNKLNYIFEKICEPHQRNTKISPFIEEVNRLSDDVIYELLADALNKVSQLNEENDPESMRLIKAELKLNKGDLRIAKNVVSNAIYLKKNKGLKEDQALDTARGMCIAQSNYKCDFNEAFEMTRLAQSIFGIHQTNPKKEEQIKTAFIVKLLTTNGEMSLAQAIKISPEVQRVKLKDGLSIEAAAQIVLKRQKVATQINSGLPKGLTVGHGEDTAMLFHTLSNDTQTKILTSIQSVIADAPLVEMKTQFQKDAKRDVFRFITPKAYQSYANVSLDPRPIANVNQDLAAFSTSENLRNCLITLMNQKHLQEFFNLANAEMTTTSGTSVTMVSNDTAEDKRTRKSASIYEVIDLGNDEIILEYTLLQKKHLVVDSEGKTWDINRGESWDGDVSETNYAYRFHMRLKLSKKDLEDGIIKPEILTKAMVEYHVSPA